MQFSITNLTILYYQVTLVHVESCTSYTGKYLQVPNWQKSSLMHCRKLVKFHNYMEVICTSNHSKLLHSLSSHCQNQHCVNLN